MEQKLKILTKYCPLQVILKAYGSFILIERKGNEIYENISSFILGAIVFLNILLTIDSRENFRVIADYSCVDVLNGSDEIGVLAYVQVLFDRY